MYQHRYWKELYQLKVHVNYVELYLRNSDVNDKRVSIFLAITSSSSICGWAIWQEYSFVWAGIIALSQLITAIKTFLPYKQRIKPLSSLLHDLELITWECELEWFNVAEGELTEAETHKLQFNFRKKKLEALKKNLGVMTLPEKKNLFKKAEETAKTYFNNFYS